MNLLDFEKIKAFPTYEDYLIDTLYVKSANINGSYSCVQTTLCLKIIDTLLKQKNCTFNELIDYMKEKTGNKLHINWIPPGDLIMIYDYKPENFLT